jgi:hypothetical protein
MALNCITKILIFSNDIKIKIIVSLKLLIGKTELLRSVFLKPGVATHGQFYAKKF